MILRKIYYPVILSFLFFMFLSCKGPELFSPVIKALDVKDTHVAPRENVIIHADLEFFKKEEYKLSWRCSKGTFLETNLNTRTITWQAPGKTGDAVIHFYITGISTDEEIIKSVTISVKLLEEPNLIIKIGEGGNPDHADEIPISYNEPFSLETYLAAADNYEFRDWINENNADLTISSDGKTLTLHSGRACITAIFHRMVYKVRVLINGEGGSARVTVGNGETTVTVSSMKIIDVPFNEDITVHLSTDRADGILDILDEYTRIENHMQVDYADHHYYWDKNNDLTINNINSPHTITVTFGFWVRFFPAYKLDNVIENVSNFGYDPVEGTAYIHSYGTGSLSFIMPTGQLGGPDRTKYKMIYSVCETNENVDEVKFSWPGGEKIAALTWSPTETVSWDWEGVPPEDRDEHCVLTYIGEVPASSYAKLKDLQFYFFQPEKYSPFIPEIEKEQSGNVSECDYYSAQHTAKIALQGEATLTFKMVSGISYMVVFQLRNEGFGYYPYFSVPTLPGEENEIITATPTWTWYVRRWQSGDCFLSIDATSYIEMQNIHFFREEI